jgi:hypothetical protein
VFRFDKLGSNAEGTVSFTSSPGDSGDFINVEILARHADSDIANRVGICVQRGGRHGVHGITLVVCTSHVFLINFMTLTI